MPTAHFFHSILPSRTVIVIVIVCRPFLSGAVITPREVVHRSVEADSADRSLVASWLVGLSILGDVGDVGLVGGGGGVGLMGVEEEIGIE